MPTAESLGPARKLGGAAAMDDAGTRLGSTAFLTLPVTGADRLAVHVHVIAS